MKSVARLLLQQQQRQQMQKGSTTMRVVVFLFAAAQRGRVLLLLFYFYLLRVKIFTQKKTHSFIHLRERKSCFARKGPLTREIMRANNEESFTETASSFFAPAKSKKKTSPHTRLFVGVLFFVLFALDFPRTTVASLSASGSSIAASPARVDDDFDGEDANANALLSGNTDGEPALEEEEEEEEEEREGMESTLQKRRTTSNKYSVLQNAKKADVRLHPYPHVIIENCLPDDVYEELERTYPSYKDILKIAKPERSISPNTRVDLRASMVLKEPTGGIVSKAWEEFVKYHSSREFYEEVIDLFGEEVFTKYHGKSMEVKYGKKLREMETEVRLTSRKKNPAPVTLDAQVGINTPVVKGRSRVRGLHVDNTHELYAGLLYFRDENDPATGGHLEVYECLKGAGMCKEYSEAERLKHRKKIGWDVQFKNLGDFKLVGEVPYEKNRFVMFINSKSSYHAVTPRSASAYPRRLVNIAANEYYEKTN